jgi:2-amino-4-hydroxy-6-hydroxymethyldihydropteridine diphosphokinase
MPNVVLGLGSNLGNPAAILQGAVDDLAACPGVTLTAVSGVYETDPVGGPQQSPYLNAVVLASTTLDGLGLLETTQGVEQKWHRVRDVRWGPRTLDIDILAVEDQVSSDPQLMLPHPRAHERAFVLVPWNDVDPDGRLPGHGTVTQLLRGLDRSGVRPTSIALSIPASESAPS